jgi:nicotinate dehydrogenase subunit B
MNQMILERRSFLMAGGAFVVGFAIAPSMALAADANYPLRDVAADSVDSFLVIAQNGDVTLYCGKVDLGTGARVAFRQIVAEELDVDFSRIAMTEGDTALCPDQGGTGGSTGITGGGMQIRQAAATARGALVAMAAKSLGVPAEELTVENGIVRARNGRTVSYASLVGGKKIEVKVDRAAKPKDPATYKVVNQPMKRPDLPAKMTGRHTYVHDFKIAGMLHARVIRAPAIGATLAEVDETSIANIPGARVVRIKDFLAVVAEKEWNAVRAARALRARWTGGGGLPGSEDVHATMRTTEIARDETLVKNGDPAMGLRNAARRFQASYQWPAQSHASMGPSCAVADYKAEGLTVWSASQGTHGARRVLARAFNLPVEKIRVIYLDGAGCYGMNGHDDAAAEAVLISREVGRPVRVQWSREEEHGFDPKGPPQLLDLRAGLDANGNIVGWETEAWLPENTPNLASRPLIGLIAAGIPQPSGMSVAQVQGNAYPSYDLPNMSATVHWLKSTPLRPSNLRAPGKPGNTFAVESFIDELAAAAGRDALEFRLAHIKDALGTDLMKRVAQRMDWKARPSPNRENAGGEILKGRGISYIWYKHADNRLALGVEVEVERRTGKVRVTRAVCACEQGLMINPDAVRAQIEGNILQTVSRTLYEEVQFDAARVTSVDWRSYPILTFPDAPVLEIDLIGSPNDKPLGAGEAASAPVPSAIGNAVFDATGVRIRRVPLTPARVLAAMEGGRAELDGTKRG